MKYSLETTSKIEIKKSKGLVNSILIYLLVVGSSSGSTSAKLEVSPSAYWRSRGRESLLRRDRNHYGVVCVEDLVEGVHRELHHIVQVLLTRIGLVDAPYGTRTNKRNNQPQLRFRCKGVRSRSTVSHTQFA